jgi:hypothetical protein
MKLLLVTCTIGIFGLRGEVAVSEQTAHRAHFVGSERCKLFHVRQFNIWKRTHRANVVCDPKEHPDAVLGDFAHPDPYLPQ